MTTQDERTLQMKREYMKLHDEGYSPREIAKKFGLSDVTVYRYLGEIAEENGVTRESLLEIPHATPAAYERQFAIIKPVDLTDFNQKFKATVDDFDKMREEVAKGINEGEKAQREFEEEESSWR